MFYVHKDGFIYNGDMTEGARAATSEEIALHLGKSQVVTPPVDQGMADIWEAMLAMASEIEALKGGE